jgi:uncharacterized protein
MLTIGVLSDTHGYLDPEIPKLFRGVDHILHGGDIGLPWLILDLQNIAPVTAVLGNCDSGIEFRETELVQVKERKFLIHHIVDPMSLSEPIKRRVIRENPDVVVFGHTHRRFCQSIGQTLFFNPGYCGKRRFNLARSVAILNCDQNGITAEYIELT